MTTMGGRQSSRMQSDVWLTPPAILSALGEFDLDPCAAPDPRPWPTATRHYALPQDGLSLPWEGRVWCNPPYSRQAVRWLRRLAEHGTGTALIFARTETSWFIETVWEQATAVFFLHGRVNFHYQDGSRAEWNGGAPSALIAYGLRDAELLRTCGLAGTYMSGWVTSASPAQLRLTAA
ncbi:DNA N-6-adenine-methyltransferase [Streptomyces sp. SID14515]|uniref:DNA N-6-adenine-methyltransferase n=1 Tax=Streptomyces sp. SID14515 TaxID=2706074 RepID=UPI001942CA54|nr:DNA N-6-adenine-methyltransferase [Streptomyces sp. SID14515]